MKTAIIIVTYNGLNWIDKCLKSCENYPIIVVDNASTDGTVTFIEKYYAHVILLQQSKNWGFGQANNIGIRKALDLGCETVFLLNQDAYLEPNCLSQLMACVGKYPNYGIISPLHLNGKGTDYDVPFYKYVNKEKINLPKELKDLKSIDIPIQVRYVNAAGWLVTKACLDQVGGFDPLFFHYGEDNNYCQRVLFFGFKIGVLTSALMRHDREWRPKPNGKYGTEVFFNKLERKLKSRYGDINKNNLKDLKNLQLKRFMETLKACVKCNYQEAVYKFKEVKLINKLYPLVKASRQANQESKFQRYL